MTEVCPLMSRVVSRQEVYNDDGATAQEDALHEVECLRERCAFWIKEPEGPGQLFSGCGLVSRPTKRGRWG